MKVDCGSTDRTLLVDLLAGRRQNVHMPDLVNFFRGNEDRFRVPEHQGQKLSVFA